MAKEFLRKLNCTKCKRDNYFTRKNAKKVERKLEFAKYCKWCRIKTKHKEKKI